MRIPANLVPRICELGLGDLTNPLRAVEKLTLNDLGPLQRLIELTALHGFIPNKWYDAGDRVSPRDTAIYHSKCFCNTTTA